MTATHQLKQLALRPLVAEDLREVLVIERNSYDFPWSSGIFNDCLRTGYLAWGAWLESKLIAYCVMAIAVDDAHILNLCVSADHHRRGIGRDLLDYMIGVAKDHCANRALLEVRPSNLAAIKLYQRSGFVQVGVRRDYYPAKRGREDALVLVKRI